MASAQSWRVLQEALLSIQTRLADEEEARLNGLQQNGKQPATLAELRKTQLHEAKMSVLEELLGPFTQVEGTRDTPSRQTNRTDYREFSSRVSPRIAVECIFGQAAAEHSSGRHQSRQRFQPMEASETPVRNTASVNQRRQAQVNDRAASARRAQLLWQEKIRTDANCRLEESQLRLEHVREVRNAARERTERISEERRARAAALAAAREEAEQEARRAREVECAVCLDGIDRAEATQLPCTHWYCVDHLTRKLNLSCVERAYPRMWVDHDSEAFESALTGRRPFRCCNEPVPVDILAETTSPLGREFVERYVLLILEQSTPNPIYCWNPTCSSFIPPVMSRGPDEMDCPKCGNATCRHCRREGHAGSECIEDVETQRVFGLASQRGWRRCPRCQAMIERNGGCSTMTCRCGTVFIM